MALVSPKVQAGREFIFKRVRLILPFFNALERGVLESLQRSERDELWACDSSTNGGDYGAMPTRFVLKPGDLRGKAIVTLTIALPGVPKEVNVISWLLSREDKLFHDFPQLLHGVEDDRGEENVVHNMHFCPYRNTEDGSYLLRVLYEGPCLVQDVVGLDESSAEVLVHARERMRPRDVAIADSVARSLTPAHYGYTTGESKIVRTMYDDMLTKILDAVFKRGYTNRVIVVTFRTATEIAMWTLPHTDPVFSEQLRKGRVNQMLRRIDKCDAHEKKDNTWTRNIVVDVYEKDGSGEAVMDLDVSTRVSIRPNGSREMVREVTERVMRGQDFVDWASMTVRETLRFCKGLGFTADGVCSEIKDDAMRVRVRRVMEHRCDVCNERLHAEYKICMRCGNAGYCGRACQKRAWRAGHRDVCMADELS
jgi:hypothetical protein